VKAEERKPEQSSWFWQWTGGVCVGDMLGSDVRISGETSFGGKKPTCGTSPETGKAAWAKGGVGDLGIGKLAGGERQWLEEIRGELQSKRYRPEPVLRVMIPKAGGGQRALGIPTLKDRVVQMAVYLVLMPIFEADFHPRSYGFRPKRSAHQAVEAVREALRIGKVEVVDADLAKYFDTIPHRKLLKQVARRVSDGMILKLIKSWLRAPVLQEDEGGGRKIVSSRQGTPQGGVISPLLANIYLHPLDEAVNEGCRQKPRMIRYADELVI
jgi:group II intron reverse transcriptase/maturase